MTAAHVIADDAEPAAKFARGAALRDAERVLPRA
jgi:hypothetical protein